MDDRTRNAVNYPPPKLLLVDHTLSMFEIRGCIKDLIREVCKRVLGVVYDLSGEVDALVGLLDEVVVSERKLEGVSIFPSVREARS